MCTFTSAALVVVLYDIPPRARAQISPLCVLTDEVTRCGSLNTFVHIYRTHEHFTQTLKLKHHSTCVCVSCVRLTNTLSACDISCVSWFARAAEGAQSIQTLTVLTQIPHHLTLVNIYTTHRYIQQIHTIHSVTRVIGRCVCTLSVCCVSGSKRTHLLVLCGSGQRAELTVWSPAAASITTTLRLPDADTTAGTHLTHGLKNLHEAEALTVI